MVLHNIRPISSGSRISASGNRDTRARATVVFPAPKAPFSQITQPLGMGPFQTLERIMTE